MILCKALKNDKSLNIEAGQIMEVVKQFKGSCMIKVSNNLTAWVENSFVEFIDGDPLRDQFAMAALTGIFANAELGEENMLYSDIANWAYGMADAMLKAREVEHANNLPESQ